MYLNYIILHWRYDCFRPLQITLCLVATLFIALITPVPGRSLKLINVEDGYG